MWVGGFRQAAGATLLLLPPLFSAFLFGPEPQSPGEISHPVRCGEGDIRVCVCAERKDRIVFQPEAQNSFLLLES